VECTARAMKCQEGIGNTSIICHLKFMAFSALKGPCGEACNLEFLLLVYSQEVNLLIYSFVICLTALLVTQYTIEMVIAILYVSNLLHCIVQWV
jgi:hypothetical protein